VEAVINNVIAGFNSVINNSEFKIYPSPASQFITISFRKFADEKVELKIFNMTGTSLRNQTINSESESIIDVKDFPSGIYYIEIKMQENLFRAKFVKQ